MRGKNTRQGPVSTGRALNGCADQLRHDIGICPRLCGGDHRSRGYLRPLAGFGIDQVEKDGQGRFALRPNERHEADGAHANVFVPVAQCGHHHLERGHPLLDWDR
jgi:hypothetical protein